MTSASKQVSVVISRDGPYIVSGDAALSEEIIAANTGGELIKWQRGKAYDSPAKYALCRRGESDILRDNHTPYPAAILWICPQYWRR